MPYQLLRNKQALFVSGLVFLYIFSVVVNLGVLEFSGEEPRRAMISVEMMQAVNYIKPTQYNWDYYNKPPFFNWILAVTMGLTGSASEFVLRLPSLLFYLLMAFFHYRITRHFFPKQIALLSAFFVLTCADVYTYALAYGTEIDIFYSFVVYIQSISMFWFYTRRQYLNLYLISYLFCAIGFLTKAFPSLVFQGLTLAALCVYARSAKLFFKWQHLAGLVLFLLITIVYFSIYGQYSSSTRYLVNLLNESLVKSGVGERSKLLLDKALIYPWLFVKMLLPWSLLLFLLVKRVRYEFRQNPLVWFSILFIAFNIWVYWLTGQPKIRYVYMFVPFACTIFTQVFHRFTEKHPDWLNRLLKYLSPLFVIVFMVIIAFPFFVKTNISWVIFLAIVTGCFNIAYYRKTQQRIWFFLAGYMLLRLVYAALFIPLQRQSIESYNDRVMKMVAATGKAPVQYWADALPFPIGINTNLISYQLETISKPNPLPLEIPYYYYRNTGSVIRFDTLPKNYQYYISYEGQLNGKRIDTLYAYFDKNVLQRVVVFTLKK